MRLIFMGTPDFAVPVLQALIDAGHEIGFAVTQPDRRRNRGRVTFSPVKELAVSRGIPVLQPERLSKDEAAKQSLRDYAPDAVIVVAYGQILKQDVLDIPKLGCFNVHGSILPKLRGASPIQHAILEGFSTTGVTIMKMGPGLDDGDMIATAETEIGGMDCEQLSEKLSHMGAELLVRTLPSIAEGTAVYTKQNEAEATTCGKITKKDGFVDFTDCARDIGCRIRAFDPWPGCWLEHDGKRIKIWKAECMPGTEVSVKQAPGTVMDASVSGIDVVCGEGILRITELQAPGKKRMAAADYLRGHRVPAGTMLRPEPPEEMPEDRKKQNE